MYALLARVERTRWLFDRLDEAVAHASTLVIRFLVSLPSADLPDAATRAENGRRLRKLHGKLGRVVTVALGDGLRLNLVRTVMRGMFLIQGRSHEQFVASTLEEGLRHLFRGATAQTPPRAAIDRTLSAMFLQLDCNPDA